MALKIIESILESIGISLAESVPIGIRISKNILSEPYQLLGGSLIEGEILSASDIEEGVDIKELTGYKIKFIFAKGNFEFDYLLIHKDCWETLRDNGLLSERGQLTLKITKFLTPQGNKGEIYPKRDIEYEF